MRTYLQMVKNPDDLYIQCSGFDPSAFGAAARLW